MSVAQNVYSHTSTIIVCFSIVSPYSMDFHKNRETPIHKATVENFIHECICRKSRPRRAKRRVKSKRFRERFKTQIHGERGRRQAEGQYAVSGARL